MERLWSIEYMFGTKMYAIHVYATEQEARKHASNLSAISCEPMDAIINAPDGFVERVGMVN